MKRSNFLGFLLGFVLGVNAYAASSKTQCHTFYTSQPVGSSVLAQPSSEQIVLTFINNKYRAYSRRLMTPELPGYFLREFEDRDKSLNLTLPLLLKKAVKNCASCLALVNKASDRLLEMAYLQPQFTPVGVPQLSYVGIIFSSSGTPVAVSIQMTRKFDFVIKDPVYPIFEMQTDGVFDHNAEYIGTSVGFTNQLIKWSNN